MTPALVWIVVTLTTQSPTLAVVAAFGYTLLLIIARALLARRSSRTGRTFSDRTLQKLPVSSSRCGSSTLPV